MLRHREGNRERVDVSTPTVELTRFRSDLYGSMSRWGDALFELRDAVLCSPAAVGSVPSLSLKPVFRRSHGSLYKALALGDIDCDRLRELLVANLPAWWPPVFAVSDGPLEELCALGLHHRWLRSSSSMKCAASRRWPWQRATIGRVTFDLFIDVQVRSGVGRTNRRRCGR